MACAIWCASGFTVLQAADLTRASKAFTHLYRRMDAYRTGTTPRLIETFSAPYPPSTQYRADVYANALAILALVRRGTATDIQRAKILGNAIIYVQLIDPIGDGRVRDAYWATNLNSPTGGPSIFEPSSSCGDMAWAIIALVKLYNLDPAHHGAYLQAAVRLGNFLVKTYKSTQGYGGFIIGYLTDWSKPPLYLTLLRSKSVEENIDVYVAFKRLYYATGDPKWNTSAAHAKEFVTTPALYDTTGGHYWVGTVPSGSGDLVNTTPAQQALDANAYPILIDLGSKSLAWVETRLKLTHHTYTGFDFNTDRDGVWFEGTAAMALVYAKLAKWTQYDNTLGPLRQHQDALAKAYPFAAGALASACHNGVSTGLNWAYFLSPDIQATSWYILAEYNAPPLKP